MLSQYIDALGALTVELRVIRELVVLYLAIFKLFPNSENCVFGNDFIFNERGNFEGGGRIA